MSRNNEFNNRQRRDYIPNDEIDREEKADRRLQKKGSVFSVLLGGLIVLSLLVFVFILIDSGFIAGAAHPIYGSPEAAAEQGGSQVSGGLTQEQKKQAEEQARKEKEEEKKKEQEKQAALEAEEEEKRKAAQEEEEKKEAEEAEKRKKEREAEAEEKKEEAEAKRKELEEEQEVLSGDYILPESSARYYSEEEVQSLTDREVLFALNEIYARKGRMFTNEEIRSYFESKSWYKGTIPPEEFDADQESHFNEYELANLSLLVSVAEQRGLR